MSKTKNGASVDTIHLKRGGVSDVSGSVAHRLLANNFNPEALRTNATLRKDEWKYLDEAVVQASLERLIGVQDLIGSGSVLRLTNGLGTTVLETEKVSSMSSAQVDMAADTEGAEDRQTFDIEYLPVPVIHKEFSISARVLNASRTRGQSLDVSQAQAAARVVAEAAEDLLFTGGSNLAFGGGTIYGYMDFPSRNTGSLTANWDDSAASPLDVVNDVIAMKQASIEDRHFGPWALYVPTNYDSVLDEDYHSGTTGWHGGKTIRERILQIQGINSVRTADKLTDDNVILAEMQPETARMVIGMDVTTLEWETKGGMLSHFKVMTIMVPQLRADINSRCGIVHYS